MNIVLWRNTDTYAFMLIYYQMSSLSTSLDQIQKKGKIGSIYLFIYLFIYLLKRKKKKDLWHKINTHSKLSNNFLTYSMMFCIT